MVEIKILDESKGQVTIFIVLGLLIVAAAVVFLMLRGEPEYLPEEIAIAERTPDEFKPVKDFITSCLEETAKEAFIRIGQHGGYVDMSDAEMSGKVFSLEPEDPTSSDAAFMRPYESGHVAYWWHLSSDNRCKDCLLTEENRPSLEYIEKQSDGYIESNIEDCLDDFSSFKRQGFEVGLVGSPSAETTVSEDDVSVLLTLPVNVTLGGKSNKMMRYFTRIPVGFREYYELAGKITDAEIDTAFLAFTFKTLLGVYGSGKDSGSIPPIYYREDSYVPKVWVRTLVEDNIRSLLTSHIPLMSIAGTANDDYAMADDPLVRGLYETFHYRDLLEGNYSDFKVDFHYIDWPVYLYIGPSSGELIKETRVTDISRSVGPFTLFPSVPTREYAFFYDISYPVVVEIRRESDLFGEGYSLFFALESNIRDNRDMKEWMHGNGTYGSNIQDVFSWVSLTETELPEEESEAGMDLGQLINRTRSDSKSLFCDPKQRLSGNVTVDVKDSITGDEVEGVKVKFGCGLYEFCTMGITGFDMERNRSILESRFPVCRGGGVLKLKKEGYVEEVLTGLSVEINSTYGFEVEMSPIVEKEVYIKELPVNRSVIYFNPYEDNGQNYTKRLVLSGAQVPPDPENDSITIMIRKADTDPLVNFRTQMVSFDQSMNQSTIELAPGIYEVKATFIDLNGANISPDLRCKNEDEYISFNSGDEDAKCYFMPEEPVIIEQTIGGGLELNNKTGYWRVTEEDLIGDNRLEIKVLKLPEMELVEDFDEMGLVENLSMEFRPFLEPVFYPN